MLKSRTGTERSDQTTTWARMAVADALLIENRVVTPFGSSRATSKYGRRRVAAGTSSIVQINATAWPPKASRAKSVRQRTVFFIADDLLSQPVLRRSSGSADPSREPCKGVGSKGGRRFLMEKIHECLCQWQGLDRQEGEWEKRKEERRPKPERERAGRPSPNPPLLSAL